MPPSGSAGRRIAVSAAAAATAAMLLVTLEWLFFVTKPSFVSALPLGLAIATLFATGSFAAVGLGAIAAAMAVPGWLFAARWPRTGKVLALLPGIGATAVTGLLLADNFTLTVLGFGIRDSGPAGRVAYIAFSAGLVAAAVRVHGRTYEWLAAAPIRRALPMLVFCGAGIVAWIAAGERVLVESSDLTPRRTPNILFLGTDGIEADMLSVYGRERPTTPNLDAMMQAGELTRFDNAFCNGAGTAASIISMLTGRLPTETGVLSYHDTLRDEIAFNHLPGLLRRAGYLSYAIAVQHFGDPHDFNMQNAFDWADFRRVRPSAWGALRLYVVGFDAYHLQQVIWGRIQERLLHIFGGEPMIDAYQAVTEPRTMEAWDLRRREVIERYIRQSREPWFIYAHMMGTHGPYYAPRSRVFSGAAPDDDPKAPETLGEEFDEDRRDDAIRDFDAMVGELVAVARERGIYDDMLLVITSDHGLQWEVHHRLPFLVHLPGSEGAGVVRESVQLLDVAPTVADYLGLELPSWMQGRSLLRRPLPPDRRFFSAQRDADQSLHIGHLSLHQWGRWYSLSFLDDSFQSGDVTGYTGPRGPVLGEDEVRRLLLEQLRAGGYEPGRLRRFPDDAP